MQGWLCQIANGVIITVLGMLIANAIRRASISANIRARAIVRHRAGILSGVLRRCVAESIKARSGRVLWLCRAAIKVAELIHSVTVDNLNVSSEVTAITQVGCSACELLTPCGSTEFI